MCWAGNKSLQTVSESSRWPLLLQSSYIARQIPNIHSNHSTPAYCPDGYHITDIVWHSWPACLSLYTLLSPTQPLMFRIMIESGSSQCSLSLYATAKSINGVCQTLGMLLTPMLPTDVSSWLDVLWVVDHTLYTHTQLLIVNVLDTNRCAWHLLPYPVQRHLNILSCPFTLWMAHIHNPCLNRLEAKKTSLTCLFPFIYTDLKWI